MEPTAARRGRGPKRRARHIWPAVTLASSGCRTPGCEREGARSETYTVVFKDQAGESYRCDLAQNAWSSFADGKRYSGKLRALTGSLDCDSLLPR